VNATQAKPIAEQNPVEVPLYTFADAARYARVPLWVVAVRFDRWHPKELFERLVHGDFLPHLDAREPRISFRHFVEVFLRAGALQAGASLSQSNRDQPTLRLVWNWFLKRGADNRPLQLDQPQIDFVWKHLALRGARVEMRDGVPVRLFPPTRDPEEASPRFVVMDPRVRFGRPVLAGRGVPTDMLFERFRAGDSPAELAADYDLTPEEVDEAIRYEATPVAPLFPFGDW
jgi:uncharacterized protein (DUF433 family)